MSHTRLKLKLNSTDLTGNTMSADNLSCQIDVRSCQIDLNYRSYQIRAHMKPDRRRLFITTLGIFQIIFGTLFLSLGSWALLEIKSSVKNTAGAPFWMTGLCFFTGYLSITTPRSYHKQWISALLYTSTFTCILALTIAVWMFIHLMRIKEASNMSYISMVMALNILVMLDAGITAAAAWSAKESNCDIQQPQNLQNVVNVDPPPAYFGSRMMYFGNDDYQPPPSEVGAPPPYEP